MNSEITGIVLSEEGLGRDRRCELIELIFLVESGDSKQQED